MLGAIVALVALRVPAATGDATAMIAPTPMTNKPNSEATREMGNLAKQILVEKERRLA